MTAAVWTIQQIRPAKNADETRPTHNAAVGCPIRPAPMVAVAAVIPKALKKAVMTVLLWSRSH